MSVLCGMND